MPRADTPADEKYGTIVLLIPIVASTARGGHPPIHRPQRFSRFYLGVLALFSADQFVLFAARWGIAALLRSPLLLSLAVVLHALPQVAVGVLGPERVGGRRPLNVIATLGALLLLACTAAAILLPGAVALTGALLASSLLGGWSNALAVPLSQASLMQALPTTARVRGSRNYELSSRIPMLLAPLIGGAAVGIGGVRPMLGAAALLFGLTAIAFRGWPSPAPSAPSSHPFSALAGSIAAIRKDSWLATALSVRGFSNLVWPALSLGLPLLVLLRFRENASAYGLLLTSYGLGTITSAALSGRLRTSHLRWLYFGSWAITGVGFIVAANTPSLALAALGTMLAGGGSPFVHMALDTHIGTSVAPSAQASLFSFQRLVMSSLGLVGSLLVGWWLTTVSPVPTMNAAGILLCLVGLLGAGVVLVRGPAQSAPVTDRSI